MNKIDKFYEIKNLMQCPRCGRKIRFHAGGLVCKREHRFDISSKGYVNLLQETKALKGYDSEFFNCRNRFLQAGYYSHIMEAVTAAVKRCCEDDTAAVRECRKSSSATVGKCCGSDAGSSPDTAPFVIIDAGCGEGYYSVNLARQIENAQILAFDISADAVKVAARNIEPVKWMVADITNIPVKDQSADCILDIFTPANYKEFARILKPEGVVIKVVPGPHHMGQLREAAAPLLRNKDYSNEEVLDYFEQHFDLQQRSLVTRTMAVSPEDLADLVRMTPLLFDVDTEKLDFSNIKEITVECEILIGRAKA